MSLMTGRDYCAVLSYCKCYACVLYCTKTNQ